MENALFWKTQRSDMTHESGSSRRLAEYPINWHDVQTSAIFKGNNKQLPLFTKWFPSHFPHHDRWVPLFGFTNSKRVTNTRYSLSEDKSRLINFMNLREEGFLPKTGLLMFNLTSTMKENSVSFMFRESEWPWKKTPKGPFSYDLVPKARNSIK